MKIARFVPLFAVTVLAAPPAQTLFTEAGKRHLPADRFDIMALALADLGGDGHLDLVTAPSGGGLRQLHNLGAGRLVDISVVLPPLNDRFQQILAGDLDRDGDQDLLLAVPGGPVHVLLNQGPGIFIDVTATHMGPGSNGLTALALADLDGDQDLDFAAGDPGVHALTLFLNDGSAHFTEVTVGRLPYVDSHANAVRAFDMDGDGDQDLIASGLRQALVLFQNLGGGVFADVTATHLPAGFRPYESVLTPVDLDGDRDLDIVVTTSSSVHVLSNTGAGVFTDATATWLPGITASYSLSAAGDFDLDGDPDLVLARPGHPIRLLENRGTAFVEVADPALRRFAEEVSALAVGDVDRDGCPDLLVAGRLSPLRLFFGGRGGFLMGSAVPAPVAPAAATRTLTFADVDGDGDPDLFTSSNLVPQQLLLNDGLGTFRDAGPQRMPPGRSAPLGYALLDLDRDGDLDALAAGSGGLVALVNQGGGTFADESATRLPALPGLNVSAVVAGDLDGDGDEDAVVAATAATSTQILLLNDGQGRFSDQTAQRLPQSGWTMSMALVAFDADGDRDLDLMLGTGLTGVRLLLNDGTGRFTDVSATHVLAAATISSRIRPVDFDADGDMDVLVVGRPNLLLRNDGTGVFRDVAATLLPSLPGGANDVACGDLDGDGILDLAFALSSSPVGGPPSTLMVFKGVGGGAFLDQTSGWVTPQMAPLFTLEATDLDRDGDLDLVALAGRSHIVVHENRLRHLGTPWLARVGRPWRIELQAGDPLGTGAPPIAAVFLGRRLLPQPLAVPGLGNLHIDPAGAIALGATLLPGPGTTGTIDLTLPTDPSLVGAQLLPQAILVVPGAGARLTGAVQDIVMR